MLLDVKNLNVCWKDGKNEIQLLKDISFEVKRNQCLGILGESGSGKSLTCGAINGLLDDSFQVTGNAFFENQDLLTLKKEQRRRIRGKKIAMILQSPMTAFNPLFTIGGHIAETMCMHLQCSSKEALDQMAQVFRRVNLSNPKMIYAKYPHELSGGMLQRVMISIALALKPSLIIADEPTTAIDYVSQKEVISELQMIREQSETSVIFISHDLSLISHLADQIMVLNKGQMVEYGPVQDVVGSPVSEHTQHLIQTRRLLVQRFNHYMKNQHVN